MRPFLLIFFYIFQRHSWFREIDWIKLENKELPVLYKPPITGPEDVHLFDKRFTVADITQESPSSTPLNGHGDAFQGFTYTGEL